MNKTFHTPKGTELPLLNLRGSDYLEVKYRLVWFREEHPSWSIETEFVSVTDRSACARAVIRDEEGRIIATSHKLENSMSFPDFMEKAETGAIGRALALIGYGTQFCAEELDEGERIVDSPVAAPGAVRASNMGLTTARNAAHREDLPVSPGDFVVHFGKKYMGRKVKDIPQEELEGYLEWLEGNAAKKNLKPSPEVELLKQAFDRYHHPEKYGTPTDSPTGEPSEEGDDSVPSAS
jgi:hypothetical protein